MSPNKFSLKEGDLQEIEIFLVWYDPEQEAWFWAKKMTTDEMNEAGAHIAQQNLIKKEFLGIPVSKLKDGAYDQDGTWIPEDDPILLP